MVIKKALAQITEHFMPLQAVEFRGYERQVKFIDLTNAVIRS